MTEQFIPSPSSAEFVELVRHEWVVPNFFAIGGTESFSTPYSGNVAVKTNHGWLLLAAVERTERGVRKRLVLPSELETVDSEGMKV